MSPNCRKGCGRGAGALAGLVAEWEADCVHEELPGVCDGRRGQGGGGGRVAADRSPVTDNETRCGWVSSSVPGMRRPLMGNDTVSRRRFLASVGMAAAVGMGARGGRKKAPEQKVRMGVVEGALARASTGTRTPGARWRRFATSLPERRPTSCSGTAARRPTSRSRSCSPTTASTRSRCSRGAPDHVRHCVAVMNAGKHVICAVPAAADARGAARQLVETKERTGRKYMMAETSYYRTGDHHRAAAVAGGRASASMVYCEGEYYHRRSATAKRRALWSVDGKRTWRWGFPPMLYPTHSTGLPGRRDPRAARRGLVAGPRAARTTAFVDNVYDNPFDNAWRLLQTDRGNIFRCNVLWNAWNHGERAQWFGTEAGPLHGGLGGPALRHPRRGRPTIGTSGPNYIERLPEPMRYDSRPRRLAPVPHARVRQRARRGPRAGHRRLRGRRDDRAGHRGPRVRPARRRATEGAQASTGVTETAWNRMDRMDRMTTVSSMGLMALAMVVSGTSAGAQGGLGGGWRAEGGDWAWTRDVQPMLLQRATEGQARAMKTGMEGGKERVAVRGGAGAWRPGRFAFACNEGLDRGIVVELGGSRSAGSRCGRREARRCGRTVGRRGRRMRRTCWRGLDPGSRVRAQMRRLTGRRCSRRASGSRSLAGTTVRNGCVVLHTQGSRARFWGIEADDQPLKKSG